MESLNERDYHQLECVQNLLSNVSASDLRDSVEDLFFSCFTEKSVVPPHDDLVLHTYHLLLFLRDLKYSDPEMNSR